MPYRGQCLVRRAEIMKFHGAWSEAASERYGWPLYVIEKIRDDPKLERPDAFVDALYVVLEKLNNLERNNK